MRSEHDLVRTLRTAAEQAGHPDLATGVSRRRRARRARQRALVAAVAVAVLAVTGGTTAMLGGGQRHAEPATTPMPTDPAQLKPVAEVWPQAVVKVPAKDAKGRPTYPVTGLSATEVLLFAEPGTLEVYDSAARELRVLGELPSPKPLQLEAGPRHIAWTDRNADLWIMPREGGAARKAGRATEVPARIGVTGDSLVWSLRQGGVYRLPLTGGAPSRLPGTDGLHLTTWPWAERYDAAGNVTRIVDLEAGRATDVTPPAGVETLQCHPQWCAGLQDAHLVVQRVDGSERRRLPDMVQQKGLGWLLGDRYALFRVYEPDLDRPGVPLAVVYDLATGTTAAIGERTPGVEGGDVYGPRPAAPPADLLYWDADATFHQVCRDRMCMIKPRGGGQEHTVLNLNAVRE
ncbi:hypothetical protein ACWEPC_13305 [Nonomuraea sp. NPDC004297]